MWPDYFKRWLDMLLWWLPRTDESTHATPKPQATPRPDASVSAAEESSQRMEPERVVKVDDLTALKGIGATMQQRLQELGIQSFEDLSAADSEQLTEDLKARQIVISQERVAGWVASARERL